ncbi:MAG: hypothetical protein ABIQ32_02450 [Sphingomicrobium sp.]
MRTPGEGTDWGASVLHKPKSLGGRPANRAKGALSATCRPSATRSTSISRSSAIRRDPRSRPVAADAGKSAYAEKKKDVGSLLLGLFDADCLLHHVGFTSALKAEDRPELTQRLERLIGPPGFTGTAPGGRSRWSTERSMEWQPLRHELVIEVRYDQVTGRRFRHGTGFLRWRPDKAPQQCTFNQLAPELRPSELAELFSP